MIHEVNVTKYTIDGYDLFDTRAEAWVEEEWQKAWVDCKAYRANDGWHLVSGEKVKFTIWSNYTEMRLREDEEYDTFEEAVASLGALEITAVELADNDMRLYVG